MQIEMIHTITTILSLIIAVLGAALLIFLTKNKIKDEDLLKAKKILQKREQEEKEERYKENLPMNIRHLSCHVWE